MSDIVQDIYNKSTRNMIIIFCIAVIVIGILIYQIFYQVHNNTNQRVNRATDSLQVVVKQQQTVIAAQQLRFYKDSMIIFHDQHIAEQVPQMLQRIHTRTNDQIHIISTLPDNEQSALFSKWLTQSDTL